MTPLLLHIYVGLLGAAGAPLHPRIASEIATHFDDLESELYPSGHFVWDDWTGVDVMLSFPRRTGGADRRRRPLARAGSVRRARSCAAGLAGSAGQGRTVPARLTAPVPGVEPSLAPRRLARRAAPCSPLPRAA